MQNKAGTLLRFLLRIVLRKKKFNQILFVLFKN